MKIPLQSEVEMNAPNIRNKILEHNSLTYEQDATVTTTNIVVNLGTSRTETPMPKPVALVASQKNTLLYTMLQNFNTRVNSFNVKNSTTVSQSLAFKPFVIPASITTSKSDPMQMKANKEGVYCCLDCSSSFKHITTYRYHLIKVHGYSTKFICQYCNKMFPAKYSLKNHELSHKNDRPCKCDQCDLGFKTKTNLRIHTEVHHPVDPSRKYECLLCFQSYKSMKYLKTHLIRVHRPTTNPRPHVCNYCGCDFSLKLSLKNHILLHTGGPKLRKIEILCDVCNKKYDKKASMKFHMMMHLNIRPFKCDTCKKRFYDRKMLRVHQLTHSGLRPFSCRLCEHKFTQSSTLYRHMHFCHNDAPMYACDICGKGVRNKADLTRHCNFEHNSLFTMDIL
jgi:hypothetical protein